MSEANDRCPAFVEGEIEVLDGSELWFRACDLAKWDGELRQASSLMFQCGSDDNGELSGARSSKTTAEDLFDHLSAVEKRDIREIRQITVDALNDEELHLHDDSAVIPSPPRSPVGHTYLDLKHLPTGKTNPAKRERERIRARLLVQSSTAHRPAE